MNPFATRWRTLRFVSLVTALGVFGVMGCYRGYHHQYQRDPSVIPPTAADPFTVAAVEADEAGWLWDRDQADRAMKLIRTTADTGRTAVVVFVHGWKHNADPHDHNLSCFRESLRMLNAELNASRTGPKRINVIGVFVGWRGKSFPDNNNIPLVSLVTMLPQALFQNATFWSRKEAANRVGRGDVRGFIEALGREYDVRNPIDSIRPDTKTFGLVTIGHSFGGEIVYRAVADRLQSQLLEASGDGAWSSLRDENAAPRDTTPKLIRGVGDLVVLINPAIEALTYEPLRRLASSVVFDKRQTPALVVVTAENDFPRNVLFHMGRSLSTFHQVRRRGQMNLERSALGTNDERRTHVLTWEPGASPGTREKYASYADFADSNAVPVSSEAPQCLQGSPTDVDKHDELQRRIARTGGLTDITDSTWIGGAHLTRVSSGVQRVVPNSPLMIIQTRNNLLINGHSGFFTFPFIQFLRRYVADIETKREHTRPQRNEKLRKQVQQQATK